MPPAKKPFGRPTPLPASIINLDDRLQMRVDGEQDEHATNLYAAIKAGAKVPRPKIMRVQPTERDANNKLPDPIFYAVDGRHTILAYIKLGKKTIPCQVATGTWEDAVIAAASANQEHLGLKRTNADKRKAVDAILALPDARHWTNSRIADQIGVSGEFVRLCRPAKSPHAEPEAEKPKTREGKDGRQYPVDRKQPARKPAATEEPIETPRFDWKGYESAVGIVVRGIETFGKVEKEFQGSPEKKGMTRLMTEFTELVAQVKKKWKAGY